jgi:hypothetical protein
MTCEKFLEAWVTWERKVKIFPSFKSIEPFKPNPKESLQIKFEKKAEKNQGVTSIQHKEPQRVPQDFYRRNKDENAHQPLCIDYPNVTSGIRELSAKTHIK